MTTETERLYRVFDNGMRCFTWPCFSWSVESDAGATTVSDVDLGPLPAGRPATRDEILGGRWWVRGRIEPGPEGPAGMGRTLRVLEAVRPVP